MPDPPLAEAALLSFQYGEFVNEVNCSVARTSTTRLQQLASSVQSAYIRSRRTTVK